MPGRRAAATKAKTHSSNSRPRPRIRVARPGDNTLEGRAQPFLTKIEGKLDELESERGAYMQRCQRIRAGIKSIYADAKDHGVPPAALKGVVQFRILEKKQAKIAASFDDIDEASAYRTLVETLGPLGIAAARAAGYALPQAAVAEDDRDLRPRHMTQPEAQAEGVEGELERRGLYPEPRADEAELARVGRGHDEPPAESPGADTQ